jgi:endonuclease YncB( thermonuclease family)
MYLARTTRSILALVLLWPTMRVGAAAFVTLTPAGEAHVTEVSDGATLALDDGRHVRLVGILAPNPPPGRKDGAPWKLADEAKTALSDLALHHLVTLKIGGAETDRWGRTLAQLYREDGLWLQGEMLKRGLARVESYADNRALVPEMLALEAEARAARRGLWRENFYAIRQADEAGRSIESFQLVEGTVADAAKIKGQVFLNLGADWHTAFTIHMPRTALPLFKEEGLHPLDLKGERIRVRGWIRLDRRPIVDVTHPEQIERLGAP